MWRASEARHLCEWVMLHRWTSHVTRTSGNPNPVEAVTYNNIAVTLKRKGKFRTALQVCTMALFQVLAIFLSWRIISEPYLGHDLFICMTWTTSCMLLQKTTIVRWWLWLYYRSRRKNRVIVDRWRSTHLLAHIHWHTHQHTHTHMQVYALYSIYLYTLCACKCVCVWMCVYVYVYVYVCACVCEYMN